MNKNFISTIQSLQPNHVIVLRCCRGAYEMQLLAQLTRGFNYVDLSLPVLSSQAAKDAPAFLRSLRLPVYLANLQYAPQLLPLLAQGALPASRVIASCTQSFALAELAQGLPHVRLVDLPLGEAALSATAGAATEVPPFTLAASYVRTLQRRKAVDVHAQLWQGYRAAYGGDYTAYLERVLSADIMYLTTVSSSEKFYLYLQAAAAMTGKVVNYVKLAQAAHITAPTAKTWLNFLLGTGIVYLLEPVQNIGLKRLVSTKKLYFRDTGLACFLLGLHSVESLAQSEHLAQLEQNYMLNKIRESYINEGLAARLRFYRDNNKKNIDLIVRYQHTLYPLMLAHKPLAAEKVQFAFSVLEEYAVQHECALGTGAIIYPEGAVRELLPGLWQLGAQVL